MSHFVVALSPGADDERIYLLCLFFFYRRMSVVAHGQCVFQRNAYLRLRFALTEELMQVETPFLKKIYGKSIFLQNYPCAPLENTQNILLPSPVTELYYVQ